MHIHHRIIVAASAILVLLSAAVATAADRRGNGVSGAPLAANSAADPLEIGPYLYDDSGNIIAIGSDTFLYDPLQRLTSGTAGPGKTKEYTYDAFGNILTIVTDENAATAKTLGVNTANNRMDSKTAPYNVYGDYDGAGNLTRYLDLDTFAYDGAGMVRESNVGGVQRAYLYSPSDERVATLYVAGTTVVQSEWTLRGPSGAVHRRFLRQGESWRWDEDYVHRDSALLAAETPAGTHHFHLDHLGTPRLVTGNGGVELARHAYYPFGEEASASSDPERLRFTGHERDDVNLDYMHARYYMPYGGRFLSVDPVIPKGAMRAPQMWNRYSYVANNPLNRVDPDGKLLRIAGCADTKSETCQKNYNLYLSTFGKQSQDAAKYLQLGKNGIVSFKGISGAAFGAKFGTMGRASNFLISNRAATFSISTDASRVDHTGGNYATTRYGNVGAEIAIDLAGYPQKMGGITQTATGALAHELGHALGTLLPGIRDAFDAQLGKAVLTMNEGYGTAFENQWRREQGMDQRLFYKYFYGDVGHTRDDVFDWPTP